MKLKIYHNTRCSKSRKALALIKTKKINIEIIEYLKSPLTFTEVKILLSQLNIKPLDLIRTHESIWTENFINQKMKDDEIINLVVKYPVLMKRPIISNNKKAVIARKTENILELFTQESDHFPIYPP